MKEYLRLNFIMTNRKLRDFGMHPFIAYVVMLVGFIGLSIYLFSKTDYAQYVYIFLALSLVSRLSEFNRNDFLKSIFSKSKYIKIRLLENSIVILPFVIFLAFKLLFISILAIIIFSLIMTLMNFDVGVNLTIPTPFSRFPFEFTVGFRNTFYIFLFSYFLLFMSVKVGNFNLGIASLVLVFLTSISYYFKPESEYYVWTYKSNARNFIIKKISVAILYSTILSLPIVIILSMFFTENIYIIIISQLIAYV